MLVLEFWTCYATEVFKPMAFSALFQSETSVMRLFLRSGATDRGAKKFQLNLDFPSRKEHGTTHTMSTMKRTPVPLPGSKPTSKSQTAPPKAQLSQEFVDSDDDSPSESTKQPKKAEKPRATIGIHVNGVPKSKPQSSKSDAPAPKTTSKSKVPPKKPAPKQIVTQEDVADLSSSEVSDDSDDAPTRDIQTKLPGNGKGKNKDTSGDSSSSDSSSSESDTDDEPQPTPNPAPSQVQARKPTQSHAVEFQPTQAYVPPKGFAPVPVNDRTVSKSAGLFDNLEGKQIWHITAPAGVSLKDLKELAMDKVMSGEAVLSYKGTNYGFSQAEKSEGGTRKVFVPRKNGVEPGLFTNDCVS